jgi:branched-chain amino acid transport system ATP-binding protein
MLRVERLTVCYGRMQALREVSLDIPRGAMVALIGANGAGKSTLLNAISGLLPAEGGDVSWDGKSLKGFSAEKICREGIVQVPEGRKLFSAMTVEENLIMGAYLPTVRKKREASLGRVYEVFPRLADRRRQLAGSLSGGEQQMAALGRAMMAQPRLLMLDEPSLGLSPKAAAEIFAIIQELNRDGLSVLLVSQDVYESLSITAYGYVLENGSVAMEGPSRNLREDPKIRESYLGL